MFLYGTNVKHDKQLLTQQQLPFAPVICYRLLCPAANTKSNNSSFTSEINEQIEDAATATANAYSNLNRTRHMEKSGEGSVLNITTSPPQTPGAGEASAYDKAKEKEKEKEKKMSSEIEVMKPILRFLQLLCENHNPDLQVGLLLLTIICASLTEVNPFTVR